MKAKECMVLMQNILQLLDEGIHVLDKHGNTIFYNDAMAALEKMDSRDVIKKPFKDVFKGLNKETSTLLKALYSQTVTKNLKQTYLNKDGKEISTINTTVPVMMDGEVIAAIEIAKNITKIEEMSKTILKLHGEIEKPAEVKHKKVKKYNFDNIVGQNEKFWMLLKRPKNLQKIPPLYLFTAKPEQARSLLPRASIMPAPGRTNLLRRRTVQPCRNHCWRACFSGLPREASREQWTVRACLNRQTGEPFCWMR